MIKNPFREICYLMDTKLSIYEYLRREGHNLSENEIKVLIKELKDSDTEIMDYMCIIANMNFIGWVALLVLIVIISIILIL